MSNLCIGYSTTETRDDAEKLAHGPVKEKLAACAQIEGPIESVYTWKNSVESSSEYRIMFKFPEGLADSLRDWILKIHPYETPEWVVFETVDVSKPYLDWAMEMCSK